MADKGQDKKYERVESVAEAAAEVRAILQKHELVEGLVHKQDMPRHELVEGLVHKQNVAELKDKLDKLHPADIAAILEQLPLFSRQGDTRRRQTPLDGINRLAQRRTCVEQRRAKAEKTEQMQIRSSHLCPEPTKRTKPRRFNARVQSVVARHILQGRGHWARIGGLSLPYCCAAASHAAC